MKDPTQFEERVTLASLSNDPQFSDGTRFWLKMTAISSIIVFVVWQFER